MQHLLALAVALAALEKRPTRPATEPALPLAAETLGVRPVPEEELPRRPAAGLALLLSLRESLLVPLMALGGRRARPSTGGLMPPPPPPLLALLLLSPSVQRTRSALRSLEPVPPAMEALLVVPEARVTRSATALPPPPP